jgi:hypothetical protein
VGQVSRPNQSGTWNPNRPTLRRFSRRLQMALGSLRKELAVADPAAIPSVPCPKAMKFEVYDEAATRFPIVSHLELWNCPTGTGYQAFSLSRSRRP